MYNLLFNKVFTFKGRSGRKEYIIKLLLFIFILVIGVYTEDFRRSGSILSGLYAKTIGISSVILLIQYFPLAVRRLHDLNTSGWWVLLSFVPFGQLLILWLIYKKRNTWTK